MTKLHKLANIGQAIWLDDIRRSFITSGTLQTLIAMGVRGMTSNPSIFENAIAGSSDYDQELHNLVNRGKSVNEIYEALAFDDISRAADLLYTVYDRTHGDDGYVSLEVNPSIAHNTGATLDEARRLWHLINRPNLMIKIPATKQGLPAITQAIAEGINVNVTLIFSLNRYREVMDAYIQGLEERRQAGLNIGQIASVASFFISRIDTKVDKQLLSIIQQKSPKAELATRLMGKTAVASAKVAYTKFCSVFEGERFINLKANGARIQRPLWASTSTKNPSYSDIKYVQELIGLHTVNTLPQKTLDAFIDHGLVQLTLEDNLEEARSNLQSLSDLGISLDLITQELEDQGVEAFATSFESLLQSITEKREKLLLSK